MARDRISIAAAAGASVLAWVIAFVASEAETLARLAAPFAITFLFGLLAMYAVIFIRWRYVGPAISAETPLPASARHLWRQTYFWRLGLLGACLVWMMAAGILLLLGWSSARFFNAALIIVAMSAILQIVVPTATNLLWIAARRRI